MKRNKIFNISFFVSTFLLLVIIILKVVGYNSTPFAGIIQFLYLISTVAYIVIALVEIWGAQGLRQSEKIMWTVALLAFNFIAALVYLISGRARVLGERKTLSL